MAQHDGVIANQGFSAFRSDLNDLAQALLSTSSGTAVPAGVVAGQFWIDTDTPSATVRTLFHYDGTDSIGIMQLDYTNNYIAKLGIGIVPSGMAAGTSLQIGAAVITANGSIDDFVVGGTGADRGITVGASDANTSTFAHAAASNAIPAYWDYNYSGNVSSFGTNRTGAVLNIKGGPGTNTITVDNGKVYIGDTSDANVTQGLTLNQGASDDALLTGKSSDVATGGVSPYETDTFFAIGKYAGTVGGLRLTGASEAAEGVVHIQGGHTAAASTTTKATTNFNSIIQLVGYEHTSGGGAAENITADGNVLSVATYKGGANTFIFGVDEDGDIYSDSSATVNVFDEYDDAEVLATSNEILATMGRSVVPSPEYFATLYRHSKSKLFGYCGPRVHARGGRPTINVSAHVRLLVGESGQRANREAIYVEQLEAMLPGFMDGCAARAVGRNVGRLPAPINL